VQEQNVNIVDGSIMRWLKNLCTVLFYFVSFQSL